MKINAAYIESVLKRYNFQKVRRGKNNYVALCPFHDNVNTPAFAIGVNGQWICNSCGAKGNIKQLHERLGGEITLEEELRMISAQIDPGRYMASSDKKRTTVLPKDFKPYEQGAAPCYITDRLKWDTIVNFKLGSSNWSKLKNRCTIPISFKGNPVGFHGRALTPDVEPKYWNSDACDIKEFLFNYDGCIKGKELIVVEGAFSCMSAWEKGFQNTVATFGTKFTPKQIQLMFSLAPESIVICFDRDSNPTRPGQKATLALGEVTHQLVPTYVMPLPIDKDPNDLTKDMLNECYKKRVAYEKIRG